MKSSFTRRFVIPADPRPPRRPFLPRRWGKGSNSGMQGFKRKDLHARSVSGKMHTAEDTVFRGLPGASWEVELHVAPSTLAGRPPSPPTAHCLSLRLLLPKGLPVNNCKAPHFLSYIWVIPLFSYSGNRRVFKASRLVFKGIVFRGCGHSMEYFAL